MITMLLDSLVSSGYPSGLPQTAITFKLAARSEPILPHLILARKWGCRYLWSTILDRSSWQSVERWTPSSGEQDCDTSTSGVPVTAVACLALLVGA